MSEVDARLGPVGLKPQGSDVKHRVGNSRRGGYSSIKFGQGRFLRL
jgi:hypothetical protein